MFGQKFSERFFLDLEPSPGVVWEGTQDVHRWPRMGKCRMNMGAMGLPVSFASGGSHRHQEVSLGAETTC